jgi:hypothetical protein
MLEDTCAELSATGSLLVLPPPQARSRLAHKLVANKNRFETLIKPHDKKDNANAMDVQRKT